MEFLIKTVDEDWFDFGPKLFEVVLTPSSVEWEKVAGYGDFRIKLVDGEVSYSFEEMGILVLFEKTEMTEGACLKFLEQILDKIKSETGQSGYVLSL